MKAIVIGATGATGKDLVKLLIQDTNYTQIDIFVRRKPEIEHEKLTVHIVDFDQPDTWQDLLNGDIAFSCMGTTLKQAGSKEVQWKIDYTYQYEFAQRAKVNGVSNFVLVSSAFASPNSPFFYAKMKGQLEEEIKKLDFLKLLIFNPPSLIREGSTRKTELFGVKLIQFFNKLGMFRFQKPMKTKFLAQAMLNALEQLNDGVHILKANSIWQYSKIK